MAKQRSPNYPAISLREAVEAVRAIYEKERKTAVNAEVMVQPLGYTSLSGNARTKLAALKKYGLIEGNDKGLRVSDLAVHILFPRDEEDRIASLKDAALRPELFKTLYNDFRDGSDEAMRHYLITKLDFAPLGAKQVIASFRDTYTFSGLAYSAYNASETSDKSEATDMQAQPESAPIAQAGFRSNRLDLGAVFASTDVYMWPLSKPRGVKAELRITGNYTRADIARLRRQIEFLEESFDENEEAAQ